AACAASCNPGIVGDTCDGYDNNCDSRTDEASDADNDGWTTCGSHDGPASPYHLPAAASVDCADNDAAVHPGAPELCNGKDDDCDGAIDDDTANNMCNRVYGGLGVASWVCTSGLCGIATCNGGYADCNTLTPDGCEDNVASDANNCGAGGVAVPSGCG